LFVASLRPATKAACRSLRTFLSSHPSDDINIGVRSTRGYHTRHLPPCRFLAVRRFTPPTPCLFYFIQAPSMGFKELVDFTSTRDRSDPENLTDLERERRVRPKTKPRTAFASLVAFLVLPSFDAPGVSEVRCLGKPRRHSPPTKRRLPDDWFRQRKRLQTDLLR